MISMTEFTIGFMVVLTACSIHALAEMRRVKKEVKKLKEENRKAFDEFVGGTKLLEDFFKKH